MHAQLLRRLPEAVVLVWLFLTWLQVSKQRLNIIPCNRLGSLKRKVMSVILIPGVQFSAGFG